MKRTLILSMLLSFSAASSLALAVELGDAQVDSTIDAPLRATVPLLATPAGLDPNRVNVSIASAGTFEALGMTLTPAAKAVRADVRRRDGTLVLDLVSQRPVTDPWLDLLLEFQMPDGECQMRELTLLLDPPGYGDQSTLVRAVGQSAGDGLSQGAAVDSSARRSAVSGPDGTSSAVIRKGDTLWSLAAQLRPDRDVSIEQTVVALFASNPRAFPTGNPDIMTAGETLRLPSREVLIAQSRSDARRQLSSMGRLQTGAGPLGQGKAPRAANDTDTQAPLEDTGVSRRPAEAAVQAAPAAQDAAQESAERTESGKRNMSDESGESEEVVRTRRLERLEELEVKWQENQRVLSAIRTERDALRDEVVNLRDQTSQLRVQVEKLVADQENQGLMPALSNMYEGVLERPLVLGGSALAALLFLLALARRRPREADPLKREALGVQAPVVPQRKPARSDPQSTPIGSRGEGFYAEAEEREATSVAAASSNKPSRSAPGSAASSDDFEARVQQLSAASVAGEADEPGAADLESLESPESLGKPADAEKNASVEYQAPACDSQASIEYQAPSLEKAQSSTDGTADKKESPGLPAIDFTPRSASDEASQAKALDASFGESVGETFGSSQGALPEGFQVEVVEYPLQDVDAPMPADEKTAS